MERGNIKCQTNHDIRGYHLLDDEGMPYVSIHALRGNVESTHIAVVIVADKRGNKRDLAETDYEQLRPHVTAAITDLRELVGDLPLHFQVSENGGSSVNCENWLD